MPVVNVAADDIVARAKYFRQMLDNELASPVLRGAELFYHDSMPDILAHCCFAISEAYKKIYLVNGHRTDSSKRAALTCATIVAIAPIRQNPDSNSEEKAIEAAYANPMLAMSCSCSIVNHPFHKRPFDDRHRVYRAFFDFSLPSIEPILAEARANRGAIISDWEIPLTSPEETLLNLLVDDFVMYSKFTIAEQEGR